VATTTTATSNAEFSSGLHKLASSFASVRHLNNNNNNNNINPSKTTTGATTNKTTTYTLDHVINSQFENEAETHILAALEIEDSMGTNTTTMEKENNNIRLLGEGIDEMMEDYYSDDDDDENNDYDNNRNNGRPTRGRNRTMSNDSFLRKVTLQNELPQYLVGSVEACSPYDETGGSPSTTDRTTPADQQHHQQQQQQQHRQQQHGRFVSTSRGSDVPNLAEHVRDASRANLAAVIRSEQRAEEGDDPFLDAATNGEGERTNDAGEERRNRRRAVAFDDDDRGAEAEECDGGDDATSAAPANADPNLRTDTTETTVDMTFMATRLRSLQKQRRSLDLGSSLRPSPIEEEATTTTPSSGDRLMDALTSVDSSRDESFVGRMRREYAELIVPKLDTFRSNASHVLLFVVFPMLCVAAILFYMLDNPMAGESGTSVSWWVLFLGVRQVLMFGLTRAGEVFWVEILALRSRLFNMAVGPYVSLGVIQSQGWPYILTFWAVLDFVFLYGNHRFPRHWLYWQDKLDLFNEANPAVGVVDDDTYMRLLASCIFVGAAASLKRLFLAVYLGRRSVEHFGTQLERLMAKMILIGEVAHLARDIEGKRSLFEGAALSGPPPPVVGDDTTTEEQDKLVRFRDLFLLEESSSTEEAGPSPHAAERKGSDVAKRATTPVDSATGTMAAAESPGSSPQASPAMAASRGASSGRKRDEAGRCCSPGNYGASSSSSSSSPPRSPGDGGASSTATASTSTERNAEKMGTSSTANAKLMYLLSEWEEPELNAGKNSKATVADLVQFRKAVSTMNDKYPFSRAFGHANTRESCVRSSQEVFDRLMLSAPSDSSSSANSLPFSILSVLAMDRNGDFVDAKIKSHIRLFRPDRDGNLSKLDFVKSVDTVYKQLRLLRASIANSRQIDLAFERIANCFFYFFLVIIAVAILGINIWTVFLSFNTFFLGFSFLFGSAASNYFEGLLLIFVRRPYDIGDRIATSNPKSDTNPNGSSTWFVDKVTLFTTTVRFATTNEVATYSNGSLAILRIINANRSPKAIISVLIKFGLETPFNKITVFRTAVENFINARPREWIALAGFRATRVEADFGYVEYKVIAQHRESWQNLGPVLQSKADLSSFCLEATKKLEMKYESPPMPVNLSTLGNMDFGGIFHNEADDERKGDAIDTGDKGDAKSQKSISAEDLQEVANLFEIRKKAK